MGKYDVIRGVMRDVGLGIVVVEVGVFLVFERIWGGIERGYV